MNPSIKRGAVSFGAAFTAAVVAAAPAAARLHTVSVQREQYRMYGRGYASNVAGGLESWDNFRLGEVNLSGVWPPWPSICDYQGFMLWKSPDNKRVYQTQFSSYHQGCSIEAWQDFPGWSGIYVENTRFGTKWLSNHTGGKWQPLGDLVD